MHRGLGAKPSMFHRKMYNVAVPRYTCQTCGSSFISVPRNGRDPRKYCSRHCFHESTVVPLEDRLWKKVVKTETCWLFKGRRNAKGYGRLAINQGKGGPEIYAHRLSWQLHGGELPEGKQLCHRCDTPNCVNPAHLYVGTMSDNMRDKITRGRVPKGRKHWYHRIAPTGFRNPTSGRFQKV